MIESTCLSDLLEKGMKKMEVLEVAQSTHSVFTFRASGGLACVCALGAMLLGTDLEITPGVVVDTSDALAWIKDVCPSIDLPVEGFPSEDTAGGWARVGDIVWNANDGTHWFTSPQSLAEIAAWLKAQGL